MNRFLVPILEGIKASFLVTTHNNIQVQVWLPSSGWVNRYWVLSILYWQFLMIIYTVFHPSIVWHGQLLKSYGSRYLLLIYKQIRVMKYSTLLFTFINVESLSFIFKKSKRPPFTCRYFYPSGLQIIRFFGVLQIWTPVASEALEVRQC